MADPNPDRRRDANRSREVILDSAETLFARKGYDSTSLQEVGAAAGLSRGTPSYFFRNKADLYRAVLERSFSQVRDAVRSGRDRAVRSGESPAVVLAGAVGEYFDFIVAHQDFVRLLEWEALARESDTEDLAPHLVAVHEAVGAIADELGFGLDNREEAAQLVLSILALCWFPLVHSHTVLRGMGRDLDDAGFMARRRQHIIDLVLHGMRDRLVADVRTPHHAEAS